MTRIYLSPHRFTRRLFNSLALLFRWSFRGMIKETVMVFVLAFSKMARSIIYLDN